jgi:hypothetical protein
MNSYIYRVANQFYNHFDLEITKFTFVFPNRRAGIFFQRYISDIADKPLFSPEILTIDECFMASTQLKVADKTEMLFILYDIYLKISGSSDTFDTFLYWGEVLLSDFNEVDKYLIDTNQLFRNITEWKEIDYSVDYLTENQIDTIKQFWSSFTLYQSENRENFLQIWQVLQSLYHEFRKELRNQGCGYEGMIFREVVENINENKSSAWFNSRNFVFIGFNALNPCEKNLMRYLQKNQKADFYWDYEAEILRDPNNPASEFFSSNTTLFPSSLKIAPVNESFVEKSFNHVTVSSGIGQARYIYHILNNASQNEGNTEQFLSTAIILPDENLLIPVLQSIPEKINKVNVTMGFPLELTPVAGLIQLIFELRRKTRTEGNQILFHHRCAKNILNHQLIVLITGNAASKVLRLIQEQNLIYSSREIYAEDKLLGLIFRDVDSENFTDYLINILTELDYRLKLNRDNLSGFELESSFIYQYYVTVKRFGELLLKYKDRLSVGVDTLISIITGLCTGISVPFVGEPLNGLQIMGVLEARGLDFENIIIPSFNEGVFPGRSFEISYIPYHLRKGFGLPTYELNDSIISYNFYRLLNRAKNIHFISDNRSESGNSGEVSRFLYQLKYQYQVDIKEIKPVFEITLADSSPLQIKKDARILDIMKQFIGENSDSKALSASSLNDYLDCSLRFYLKHIGNFNKEDEISELVESDVFGNIFHYCMAELYEPFKHNMVSTNDIEKIINNESLIRELIYKAFNIYFYKSQLKQSKVLDGNNLLISNIVFKYIIRVLEYDKSIAPFRFIGAEIRVRGMVETKYGRINLKGYIDRVDEKDSIIRIIDYKTGKGQLAFKGIEKMFEYDAEKSVRAPFALQTFLYALLFKNKANTGLKIQPGIYYLKNIFSDEFDWRMKDSTIGIVEDFDIYAKEYTERLVGLIENIFDPDIPFHQTNQLSNCEYCDFKVLCNR